MLVFAFFFIYLPINVPTLAGSRCFGCHRVTIWRQDEVDKNEASFDESMALRKKEANFCMFASVLGGLLDVLVALYVGSPLELNLCDVGEHWLHDCSRFLQGKETIFHSFSTEHWGWAWDWWDTTGGQVPRRGEGTFQQLELCPEGSAETKVVWVQTVVVHNCHCQELGA